MIGKFVSVLSLLILTILLGGQGYAQATPSGQPPSSADPAPQEPAAQQPAAPAPQEPAAQQPAAPAPKNRLLSNPQPSSPRATRNPQRKNPVRVEKPSPATTRTGIITLASAPIWIAARLASLSGGEAGSPRLAWLAMPTSI
jgi:hypothetical protein